MYNKNLGYALMAAGALDFGLWLIQGYGWTEIVFGVGIISMYAWMLLISVGYFIVSKAKTLESAELSLASLPEGENVIFTESRGLMVLTVTNLRILYTGDLDDLRKNTQDLPENDEGHCAFIDIESVRKVSQKDTSTNAMGRKLNLDFGIQLAMKNGQFVNLPSGKTDIIMAHVNKHLKANS